MLKTPRPPIKKIAKCQSMEVYNQHVAPISSVPKNLLLVLDPMKKLATPPHLLPTRACKSKVSEINKVFLGNNVTTLRVRMKKRRKQAPHQEADVHTIVEDGVVIGVSGHDIMPPLLVTKIVDPFQKGNGKGEANA